MSIIDSLDDYFDYENAFRSPEISDLQSDIARRIMEMIFRGDRQGDLLMVQLAWLGSSPEKRPLIEREIAHLVQPSDEWEFRQIKSSHPVKQFWKDHKKEIIITVVVVAVVVAATVAIVYASGVGAEAVVTGGAAVISSLANEPSGASGERPSLNSESCSPRDAAHQDISLGETTITPPPIFYEPPVNLTDLQILNNAFPQPFIPPPTPPIPQISLTPQLNWETVFGEAYVSQLYQQFQLPDPYAGSERPSPNPPSNEIVKGPQQFVEPIEMKPDPNFRQDAKPNYHQQFFQLFNEKLREAFDPSYMATMQTITALFKKKEMPSATVINNYATLLSSSKPTAPFYDIPLLGFAHQSTIHFHCGISNTFSSVVEGGLRLNESLVKQYAVQPHLLHSRGIIEGLSFVGLEKLAEPSQGIPLTGVASPILAALALENSQIQRSIDYEVETLTKIAQNIIANGNPNLKQVHVTFSNGGYVFKEALKQLPPEYRETIVVVTSGTTAIIDKDLACKAYNVIGDKDWPSQRCNGKENGITAAKEWADVEVIQQTETEGAVGGHYFMQPEYQDRISNIIIEEIANEYEIY